MSTARVGLPNAATVLRCKVVASRLPSSRASRIMNRATASRFISSHSSPRVHIAASNALPIADRASGEKTTPCSRYRLIGISVPPLMLPPKHNTEKSCCYVSTSRPRIGRRPYFRSAVTISISVDAAIEATLTTGRRATLARTARGLAKRGVARDLPAPVRANRHDSTTPQDSPTFP